jgi:GNAT superfamily N-acetyltransferase
MSEFHERRRAAITDTATFLGFLIGFLAFAPMGWRSLTDGFVDGAIARAIFEFGGYVLGGGLLGAGAGMLLGRAGGHVWQRLEERHRLTHPPVEKPERRAPPDAPRRAIDPAARFDRITYGRDLDVDTWLGLAQRVWPRDYDRDAAATALTRTTNIAAWHEQRLVGAVRVLTDGYLFATVTEILVDPDYRFRGIGKELMRQALDVAPREKLFIGAQRQALGFFDAIGGDRNLVGFVLTKPRAQSSAGAG